MVRRTARQISAHAERSLNTLVVAGKLKERAIAHALVEELGSFIPGAHFQGHVEYSCYDGALLEPFKQLPGDARSSIGWSHSEKIEVSDIFAVAHYREPGNIAVNPSD
jgi:hypothetical protein